MSGFTFASGVMTTTVTAVCPECLTKQSFPWDRRNHHGLTLAELCCSPQHAKAYEKRVYALEKAAWRAIGRERLPSKVAQRIKRVGTLSNRAERFLGNKV